MSKKFLSNRDNGKQRRKSRSFEIKIRRTRKSLCLICIMHAGFWNTKSVNAVRTRGARCGRQVVDTHGRARPPMVRGARAVCGQCLMRRHGEVSSVIRHFLILIFYLAHILVAYISKRITDQSRGLWWTRALGR